MSGVYRLKSTVPAIPSKTKMMVFEEINYEVTLIRAAETPADYDDRDVTVRVWTSQYDTLVEQGGWHAIKLLFRKARPAAEEGMVEVSYGRKLQIEGAVDFEFTFQMLCPGEDQWLGLFPWGHNGFVHVGSLSDSVFQFLKFDPDVPSSNVVKVGDTMTYTVTLYASPKNLQKIPLQDEEHPVVQVWTNQHDVLCDSGEWHGIDLKIQDPGEHEDQEYVAIIYKQDVRIERARDFQFTYRMRSPGDKHWRWSADSGENGHVRVEQEVSVHQRIVQHEQQQKVQHEQQQKKQVQQKQKHQRQHQPQPPRATRVTARAYFNKD